MSAGMLVGESIEVYHDNGAVSHSKLEVFGQRPALYRKQYIEGALARKETDAFTFGSMFHCKVLEPDKFESRFAVPPECDRRTNVGKDLWNVFSNANAGKTLIAQEDCELANKVAAAIWENPFASELLRSPGGSSEVTFRTPKLAHGHFAVQCRADHYNPNGCEYSHGQPFVADIKTVDDLDRFPKHFVDYSYYRQAPFYQRVISTVARIDGTTKPAVLFYFIAVEKQEPFGCTVFECDPASITVGLQEIDTLLGRLAGCYASNMWPNAPMHQHIGLPAWKLQKAA